MYSFTNLLKLVKNLARNKYFFNEVPLMCLQREQQYVSGDLKNCAMLWGLNTGEDTLERGHFSN